MRTSNRFHVIVFSIISVGLLLLTACNDSNDKETLEVTQEKPSSTIEPKKDTVITIGNLTDLTGPASNALAVVTIALEDMVKYYNEQNLIPGIELKVVSYDEQFDPAKDLPGYEWLKEKGADVIFTPISAASIALKPFLEKDDMVVFSLTASDEDTMPPGRVFCPSNTLSNYHSYTLLKWLTENDPDFPEGRPARIAGAGWAENLTIETMDGLEEYTETHSDQFEWEGSYLTNFGFVWTSEIEEMKDCDYVLVPASLGNFVKGYRDAGYKAKFLASSTSLALWSQVDQMDVWDEVDGMLIITPNPWWTEECELISTCKELLYRNHPDQAESIIKSGNGYLATSGIEVILEVIADAAETVGAANLDGQAIYEAAQLFSMTTSGVELYSFSEVKRTASNYLWINEVKATEQDVFRVDMPPVVYEP